MKPNPRVAARGLYLHPHLGWDTRRLVSTPSTFAAWLGIIMRHYATHAFTEFDGIYWLLLLEIG